MPSPVFFPALGRGAIECLFNTQAGAAGGKATSAKPGRGLHLRPRT
jgi:hypothetical protein